MNKTFTALIVMLILLFSSVACAYDCTQKCNVTNPDADRDTYCIQQELDLIASQVSNAGERVVELPAGICLINETLEVTNSYGMTVKGVGPRGTQLIWDSGETVEDFFALRNNVNLKFEGFMIHPGPGTHFDSAFEMINDSSVGLFPPTENVFERIHIHGGLPHGSYNYAFSISKEGIDSNNERHQWHDVDARNYDNAGWFINGSQNHLMFIENSLCRGADDSLNTTYCVYSRGSFTSMNMSGGNNDVDFWVGNRTKIYAGSFEGSKRFIEIPNTPFVFPVVIDAVRWASNGVNSNAIGGDRYVVWLGNMNVHMRSCEIGYGTAKPLAVYLGGVPGIHRSQTFENNVFGTSLYDEGLGNFWVGNEPTHGLSSNLACTSGNTCENMQPE